MVPRLRPRRTFPKNRFRLEWFDVLLEQPMFVPLNTPTVTIGLKGKNTWNIPIEAFQVDGLRKSMPPWDSPLVTLTYDVQAHTWSSRRHHPESSTWATCGLTKMFPYSQRLIPVHYPAVPLEIGVTLEIHLHEDGVAKDDHGTVTVMLVDMYPSPATLGCSDCRPLFTDMLAALPAIPLAIIAGYLGPHDCLKNLCALSPAIPQKLCQVGVSWPVLHMLPLPAKGTSRASVKPQETLLDCLRAARLANEQAVTSFGLGEQLNCVDAGEMVKLLLPRVRNFLLGTKLEELHVASVWLDRRIFMCENESEELDEVPSPSPTLKRTTVHRGKASDDQHLCYDFWIDVESYCLIDLSEDTEVYLSCTKTLRQCHEERRIRRENGKMMATDERDSDSSDDEEDSRDTLTKINPMPNVKEISWLFCNCKAWIPFKAFPNLRKMRLDLVDFCDKRLWEESRHEHAATLFGQVSLPLLKDVSLRAGINSTGCLLEAIARAAPNVECLTWAGSSSKGDAGNCQFYAASIYHSLGAIENFLSLKRLQISLRPSLVGKVDMLMDVCVGMPAGLSRIVIENVKCRDPADSEIQEEVVRLIANNKQVTLEPADGSGVGRITYPLTGPVDGGHDGASLYNLLVLNAPAAS